MIDIIELPEIFSDDGTLTKILYLNSNLESNIKEVYLNNVNYEKTKGWICHQKANIYLKVVKGKIKLSLVKNKIGILDKGEIQDCEVGDNINQLIRIKNLTWFKFKGLNIDCSTILVMSDQFHDSTERIKSDPNLIPKFFN